MYKTRFATEEDLPIIVQYWTKMSIEMSKSDSTPMPTDERIEEINQLFHMKHRQGDLIFRVAVDKHNQIVACAGGLIRYDYPWPLSSEQAKVGWVVSVYTELEHRKQGLAYNIVQEVTNWLESQQVQIIRLWASQHGKTTYEKLGFMQTTFMDKVK